MGNPLWIPRRIFEIRVSGRERTTEEVLRGREHTEVSRDFTSQNFPFRQQTPGIRTIEFLEFDHEMNAEKVLAEAERRNLSRPTYEDALLFDEEYPDELGTFEFLIQGMWRNQSGKLLRGISIAHWGARRKDTLRMDFKRDILLVFCDYTWHPGTCFGFLQKAE